MYTDYTFKNNFLVLSGGRLHYVDEGCGPVIVMVHGNPTWSYFYRHLINHLKKSYRVIALDHMGCGLSDKPPGYPYCLAQHIDNLDALLTHLKIERFSLVVHDWGGAIGFGCALRRLEQIEKIVVMNTAAFRSTRIPWRIRICRIPILGEIIVRLLNGFAGPACFMAVEKRLKRKTIQAYLAPYNNWFNRIAISKFVEDIPLDEKHPSYPVLVGIEKGLADIRALNVPLLILWGAQDFCFNDHFFREWCRRFPEAENHFFVDGGHYLLEDKLDEIRPIIDTFFSASPGGGR